MSLCFLSLVCIISSLVLNYRDSYIEGDENIKRFVYLVLGFVVSMCLLIISPNLIRILLGWDGLGLISYALVIYYQNEKSANAGILTVLSNRVGDVAILIRIGIIRGLGGWNFLFLTENVSSWRRHLWFFIFVRGLTKRAQIPFSAWLPAAMAAPTPVSALVHSSTLVTAGVYLLIRFSPLMEGRGNKFLLFIARITIVMAGLAANYEFDLKKIIALSTLSQLGVIMRTLAMGYPMLAFFHLLTHALFKALLFMCAGCVIHGVGGRQDIRAMGGLVKFIPIRVSCMNLANLALCGIPFLAGFYSKDLILEIATSCWIRDMGVYLLIFATGLTVIYSLRLTYCSMLGGFNEENLDQIRDESKIVLPILVLRGGAIIGGCFFSWILFPSPSLVCLDFFTKTLALRVRVAGLFVGYSLNGWRDHIVLKELRNNRSISEIFRKIWFIEFIFTKFVSSKSLPLGRKVYKLGDKGWLELYGGQGLYRCFTTRSWFLETMRNRKIKLHLISFLLIVAVIIFLV